VPHSCVLSVPTHYLILVSCLFQHITSFLCPLCSYTLPHSCGLSVPTHYLILVSCLFLHITSFLCPLCSFTLPHSCVLSVPTHYLILVSSLFLHITSVLRPLFSYTFTSFLCPLFPTHYLIFIVMFLQLPHSPFSMTHIYLIPSALHTFTLFHLHYTSLPHFFSIEHVFRQNCARLPY
jgi:hypothetical protein